MGIETTTAIFFTPSHLSSIGAMVSVAAAVLTLALAASLVLLFLTYGNALLFGADGVVEQLSDRDGPGAAGSPPAS